MPVINVSKFCIVIDVKNSHLYNVLENIQVSWKDCNSDGCKSAIPLPPAAVPLIPHCFMTAEVCHEDKGRAQGLLLARHTEGRRHRKKGEKKPSWYELLLKNHENLITQYA